MLPVGLDLEALRSFVVVGEKLIYHEAAAQLGLSPAALTRRIQRLEAIIGIALFERSTRMVGLTPSGRMFLPRAQAVLADLEAAVREVQQDSRERAGQISIAVLPSMTRHLLPRVIRDFRVRFPEIYLRVTECGASAVVRAVRADEAEFGFTFRAAPDSDLAFDAILTDPYVLAIPKGHALSDQPCVAWNDLKPHRLIMAGPHSGNMRLLDQALRGIDWRPETAYEIDHLTTSLGLVAAGLGIAVLPRSALPPSGSSGVEARMLTAPEVSRTLGIYRRRGRKLPRLGQQFLNTVRRTASALAAEENTLSDTASAA